MRSLAWRAFERRVAAFFFTSRTEGSGAASGVSHSDTKHPHLFVECKQRSSFSIVTLWRRTAELAGREDKIPLLALHEKGSRDGFFVVIRSTDLVRVLRILEGERIVRQLAFADEGYRQDAPGKIARQKKELAR